MVCMLCQKRVKIVDADISVDTVWCPKYLYVVTKNVSVLENVTLKIKDSTKVYLLNGFDFDAFEYISSLNFTTGSKLCSKNWSAQAVDEVNGSYVVSKNPDNGGINFTGTLTDESPEIDTSKLNDRLKCWRECCLKKYSSCSTRTKFVIGHLTVDHVELSFTQIAQEDANIHSLTVINNFAGLFLFSSYLTLTSLVMKSDVRQYSSEDLYGDMSLTIFDYTLTVKEKFEATGLYSLDSKLVICKGAEVNILVVIIGVNTITPCPLRFPSVVQSPWYYKDTLKCTTTFEDIFE